MTHPSKEYQGLDALPNELLLKILKDTDFKGAFSLLQMYPSLQRASRVIGSYPDAKPVKFTFKQGQQVVGFFDYDPPKHRTSVRLIELDERDIRKILKNPSEHIHKFDRYTLVFVEFTMFHFYFWRFFELLRLQGSKHYFQREDRWVREACVLRRYMRPVFCSNILESVVFEGVTQIRNFWLPNCKRLKISFADNMTKRPLIQNLNAPKLVDFRVHYTIHTPIFEKINVGSEGVIEDDQLLGQCGFELADRRALQYNNPAMFESETPEESYKYKDFKFTRYFQSIYLIGSHDSILQSCYFDRLPTKVIVWRRACRFQDSANYDKWWKRNKRVLHAYRCAYVSIRVTHLFLETNIPGTKFPGFSLTGDMLHPNRAATNIVQSVSMKVGCPGINDFRLPMDPGMSTRKIAVVAEPMDNPPVLDEFDYVDMDGWQDCVVIGIAMEQGIGRLLEFHTCRLLYAFVDREFGQRPNLSITVTGRMWGVQDLTLYCFSGGKKGSVDTDFHLDVLQADGFRKIAIGEEFGKFRVIEEDSDFLREQGHDFEGHGDISDEMKEINTDNASLFQIRPIRSATRLWGELYSTQFRKDDPEAGEVGAESDGEQLNVSDSDSDFDDESDESDDDDDADDDDADIDQDEDDEDED